MLKFNEICITIFTGNLFSFYKAQYNEDVTKQCMHDIFLLYNPVLGAQNFVCIK